MSHLRPIVARLVVCSMFFSQPVFAAPQASNSKPAQKPESASLRIVVVSGEDAVNIIQQKTAVAPIVEVRDRNNQPVAGALVTFSIQGGGNATFAGASTLTATTNALGQAAVTSLTPTGAGAVQINVAAAFQGQTATAAITQTNFATAAQAAAAGSSASSGTGAAGGSGGGGGIGAGTITTLGLVGAGAVGGLYAYRNYQMGEAPIIDSLQIAPAEGIQGMSLIVVGIGATWHGEGTSLQVDFGDGTNETRPADGGFVLTHIYSNAGTYRIRATLTDAWDRRSTNEGSVTIKSLTARWNVGNTGNFFSLTQSGSSVSGTYTTVSGQGSGVVSGSLVVVDGRVGRLTLNVSPTSGGNATTFGGNASGADTMGGTLTTGSTTTMVTLVRQ